MLLYFVLMLAKTRLPLVSKGSVASESTRKLQSAFHLPPHFQASESLLSGKSEPLTAENPFPCPRAIWEYAYSTCSGTLKPQQRSVFLGFSSCFLFYFVLESAKNAFRSFQKAQPSQRAPGNSSLLSPYASIFRIQRVISEVQNEPLTAENTHSHPQVV